MTRATRTQSAQLRQVRAWLRERRGHIAALVAASVGAGLSEAALLAAAAQVAAALVDGTRTVHVVAGPLAVHASIGVLLGAAFALAAVRLVLQAPLAIIPARLYADVQAQMQRELFDAFTRASWQEQSREREGYLQELVANQVFQATWTVAAVTAFITSALTLVVLVVSALLLNVIAAVAVLATAVALFALLRPLTALGARRSRALSEAQMRMASALGQAARLAEETHTFDVAAAQRAQIAGYVGAAQGLWYRTQMLVRLTPGVYQSLVYLLLLAALAALAATHAGHTASLGAVVLLLIRAGAYGQQVQSTFQAFRQAVPFLERVQEAQLRYALSERAPGERPLPACASLAFRAVSFAYRAERAILRDVSFEVRAGEAIGLMGPSGAGKSTLVSLLLQLREPTGGEYLINGVPGREFRTEDWYARVAYVPQEPRLLHASVAENIRFYRDLDDAAVERAARLARIDDEIRGWVRGYDTIIGPRADAVSGGQQQRICIARALAGDPDVLILDEPTSALDPHSERLLQESLAALAHRLTLFVIAHRLSTLDICDRVMVLVDGRLEDFDTPDRLHGRSTYYRAATALAGRAAGAGAR